MLLALALFLSPASARAFDALSLGITALEKGQYRDAERHLLESVRETEGGDAEHLAAALLRLTAVRIELGRYNAAEETRRRAEDLIAKSSAPAELEVEARYLAGRLHLTLARYEAAASACDKALRLGESKLGPSHRLVAMSLSCIVRTKLDLDRTVQSEHIEMLQRALSIANSNARVATLDRVRIQIDLSLALNSRSDFSSAAELIQKSMRDCRRDLGPESHCMAETSFYWASAYLFQKQALEAIIEFDKAIAITRSSLDSDHPLVGLIESYEALALILAKRYKEAADTAEAAISHLTTSLGENHPSVANAHYHYGFALLATGQFAEGDRALSKYVQVREAVFGKRHAQARDAILTWAKLKRAAGRVEEADALEKTAQ